MLWTIVLSLALSFSFNAPETWAYSSTMRQNRLRSSLDLILATPPHLVNSSFIPEEMNPLMPYMRHLNLKQPKKLSPEAKDLTCDACIVAAEAVIDLFLLGASIEVIEEAALVVCDLFNIEDHEVCRGSIWNYAPQLEYILSQRRVRGSEVCAILLLQEGCGAFDEVNGWTVELPAVEKPPVATPSLPPAGSPTRKVLQISDIHLDLSYTIGSLAGCDLPNCCMNISGVAELPEDAAQYWGDYRCDLPHWTFKHILEHIKSEHGDDFEYIMVTGDYPAHDVWLQSREGNLAHSKKVIDLLKEAFPTTNILPSLGNHESFPCNNYPTSDVDGYDNPSWLYSTLGEYFSDWLSPEALDQFRIDGFYRMDLNDDLRIIAVNSNVCINFNFFLLLGWEDPASELAWLVEELLAAEMEGKKVHILSHVPSGNDDCLGAWGREFSKIINRFEGTVMAQFYGHTHNDEFEIFYDPEDSSRATSVSFIAPSVTTIGALNPAYRIYTMDAGYDGASYRMLNHETYIFNMLQANNDGEPSWYRLYSALEDLEMESLFPQDFDNLVRRMWVDDAIFGRFMRYFAQDVGIDVGNRYEVLCRLLVTTNLDKSKCDEILVPTNSV